MPRFPAYLAALSLAAVACHPQETYQRLRSDAAAYLQVRQGTLVATYQLDKWPHYDWNQDSGTLVFSDSGVPRVVASVQFVGDISNISHTWLWAWDNATIDHQLAAASRAVRRYGYLHWIPHLFRAQWPATEEDA